MAEMAVSFAIEQLLPLLTEEVNLLKGVHKEFADLKDELESIQAFVQDADRKAAVDRDETGRGVKTWVRQLREVAFRIEDITDKYMMHVGQQPRNPGCAVSIHNFSHLFKSLKRRHDIASEIQDIKSSVCRINKAKESYGFQRSFEQGSSSSGGGRNAKWYDPRVASLFIDDADVVGFEAPRKKLIDLMIKGRKERTVISVVGMGGEGKTTLVKKVFDSKDVMGLFDCRAWITVSQPYDVKVLLTNMLLEFFKQEEGNPPPSIYQMDRGPLTNEVRKYLEHKRYVVVFDDVWNEHFWDDIESAVIDTKNGSKIFITTRKMGVVMSCRKSSLVEVLELPPLTQKQSFELFSKKAFKFDNDGCCPKELIGISNEIVKKCQGLPLAIVVIGGLLCIREKNGLGWQKFRDNLNLELMKDPHLIGIKEILGLSYNDLPYYLKSCFLYFGIYPEDYEVRSKRVIRQWIAEGFVKDERGKTLEEVAEGYLTELIHRSLVKVSSLSIDGRAKVCRVHDLVRDMILEKNEDLNFCKYIHEDRKSSSSGIIRRLSITTISDDFMARVESSHVRSLHVFKKEETLISSMEGIPTKYKLLKVVDYESVPLYSVPRELGNLIHLKYLSFRHTKVGEVQKSIGMLQNLETLDLRDTFVRELPKEIRKLKKLRHLIGTSLSLIQVKDCIGEMTSLQTLHYVYLDRDGAVEIIKELGKLKQMRDLRLINFPLENGSILSSSINEMLHLEKLIVHSNFFLEESLLDLNLISPPTMLQKLTLSGPLWLQKLPEWIPELHNLVSLRLIYSTLSKDPMQFLKNLQQLLILEIEDRVYEFLCLRFEDGGFQKLKELAVSDCFELREIIIDNGALPSLKKLHLCGHHGLKNIPTGMHHLEKLEVLQLERMDNEFVNQIFTNDWIMEHVPPVQINVKAIRSLRISS